MRGGPDSVEEAVLDYVHKTGFRLDGCGNTCRIDASFDDTAGSKQGGWQRGGVLLWSAMEDGEQRWQQNRFAFHCLSSWSLCYLLIPISLVPFPLPNPQVLVAVDETVWVVDDSTATDHPLTPGCGGVVSLAVSPDGAFVALQCGDGKLRVMASGEAGEEGESGGWAQGVGE